jgi:ferritin-like metal-binding protein YciE
MTTWADAYLTMLDDCEKRESQLTDWERGFVDSLHHQIEQGSRPTVKQIETLDSVWEKATARG